MKCARVWFLLALLPLLTGCFPSIYSEQPLGEPAVLDPEKWNGRWLSTWVGDRTLKVSTLTVVDADTVAMYSTGFGNGDGGLSSVCDPLPTKMVRLSLREFQGWYIVYKKDDKISIKDGLYVTSMLIRLKHPLMHWSFINEQRVKALIEQGELPGRIEGHREILGALTQEHYKLLFQPRSIKNSVEYPIVAKDDYPDFPDPMIGPIWIKLPAELDPCKKGDKGK